MRLENTFTSIELLLFEYDTSLSLSNFQYSLTFFDFETINFDVFSLTKI